MPLPSAGRPIRTYSGRIEGPDMLRRGSRRAVGVYIVRALRPGGLPGRKPIARRALRHKQWLDVEKGSLNGECSRRRDRNGATKARARLSTGSPRRADIVVAASRADIMPATRSSSTAFPTSSACCRPASCVRARWASSAMASSSTRMRWVAEIGRLAAQGRRRLARQSPHRRKRRADPVAAPRPRRLPARTAIPARASAPPSAASGPGL